MATLLTATLTPMPMTPMPMTVGTSALKIRLQKCKLGPCLQRATGDWLRVRNKDDLHHRYDMISSDDIIDRWPQATICEQNGAICQAVDVTQILLTVAVTLPRKANDSDKDPFHRPPSAPLLLVSLFVWLTRPPHLRLNAHLTPTPPTSPTPIYLKQTPQ